MVTGASSGIGTDFARILAHHGASLVLVARRRDRLEQLKSELSVLSPQIDVIEADLAREDEVNRLLGILDGLSPKVDGVINNAGFGISGDIQTTSWAQTSELCRLNILALTQISLWAAQRFEQKRSGWILNVASTAAFQPVPRMSVYAASKAFVSSWTMALHEELRQKGVAVSALHPGKTETEFFEVASMTKLRFFKVPGMRSRDVAEIGLRGLAENQPLVIAGLLNRCMAILANWSPIRLKLWVARKLFDGVS